MARWVGVTAQHRVLSRSRYPYVWEVLSKGLSGLMWLHARPMLWQDRAKRRGETARDHCDGATAIHRVYGVMPGQLISYTLRACVLFEASQARARRARDHMATATNYHVGSKIDTSQNELLRSGEVGAIGPTRAALVYTILACITLQHLHVYDRCW